MRVGGGLFEHRLESGRDRGRPGVRKSPEPNSASPQDLFSYLSLLWTEILFNIFTILRRWCRFKLFLK